MNRAKNLFVICIKNRNYPGLLETAATHKQVRVIDESGEDYLYPADYFVSIRLPQAVEKAVLQAS